MIIKKEDLTILEAFGLHGGTGKAILNKVVPTDDLDYPFGLTGLIEVEAHAVIGTHYHIDNYELCLVVEGSFQVIENQEEQIIQKGDMLITGKGQRHSFKNLQGTVGILFIVNTKDLCH
ncbi:cupin domain-containing protein [Spirochaeta cellobiosiphila]|uniref:cupin domain-containing protein n=1 Tax=Spirochaeta cellobiosiphila TaxID=504483 RepID=UPI00041942DC|nr:cupin domain-containing protein [Spirochaeta cellobiosiphila]